MALPSNWPLSMQQMRDEYGLGNPVSMNQFYGKPGIQASGTIAFSDFLGKSNVAWSVAAGNHVLDDVDTVSFYISCTVPAVWTYTVTGTATGRYTYPATSGATANYFNCSMSTTPKLTRSSTWTLSANAQGITRNWTIRLTAYGNQIA